MASLEDGRVRDDDFKLRIVGWGGLDGGKGEKDEGKRGRRGGEGGQLSRDFGRNKKNNSIDLDTCCWSGQVRSGQAAPPPLFLPLKRFASCSRPPATQHTPQENKPLADLNHINQLIQQVLAVYDLF